MRTFGGKIIRIFGGAILGGLLIWLGSEVAVTIASRGRTFDHLSDVPKREFGLVLGTSKYVAPGRPNLHYQYRIEAAARLFQAGKVRRFIVSGNGAEENYNEPRMMKADLVARGVPPGRIVCDDQGLRTFDSVTRAAEVFHVSSCIVVSQAAHNERAIFIGRVRGQDLLGWNARDVGFFIDPRTAVREQLARVKAVWDVFMPPKTRNASAAANALSFQPASR